VSDLIQVRDEDGNQVVMARDLHELLGLGKDYSTWLKHMTKYGFIAGRDYTEVKRKSTGGRPRIDHLITLDMAVTVCQYQRTQIGDWAAKSLLGEDAGEKPAPRKRREKWVYFIATMDDTMVKIGAAQNVEARLAQLQAASPQKLHIVAAIPGGTRLERELHHKFAKDRSHYEWFQFSTDIKTYIQGGLFQQVV